MSDWDWTIGRVVAAFGVRGEASVVMEQDQLESFSGLEMVSLRAPGGRTQKFAVESIRYHKGRALIKFKGIDSRDALEPWRDALVQILRDARPTLGPDSFYVSDLLGCEVFLQDGQRVGTIDDVLRYPAQDLWKVGEALIPAVKAIVVSVDLEARRVVISPPKGLLGDDADDED